MIDFGSLFDSFLELKWRPKLAKMMSKTVVENSIEIKKDFDEKIMELRYQNVRFHCK